MDEFYNMLRWTIHIIFSWLALHSWPESFEFQSLSLEAALMIFDQWRMEARLLPFLQGRPCHWKAISLNEIKGIPVVYFII